MRKLIVAVLVLAAGGAGAYWWRTRRTAEASAAQAPQTAEVTRGPIRDRVTSTGRVVAHLDVAIKCKASGLVSEVLVDVSDVVTKNQPLFRLDPKDEQREVDRAKVALQGSQSRRARAEHDLAVVELQLGLQRKRAATDIRAAEAREREARLKAKRAKQLFEKELISEDELVTAESAADQASASLDAAKLRNQELDVEVRALDLKREDLVLASAQARSDEISLAIAEQRLADTEVLAPIAGVVATREIEIGQIISSGISNVGGGTAVMTLSDLSRIFVLARVDESQVGRVAVDKKARIEVDAHPGVVFAGEVRRVATRGLNEANVVTFEVKVEVTSPNRRLLKPEMTANVEIVIDERDDAVLVPLAAVQRGRGGAKVEVVGKDGQREERVVKIGIDDGLHVEVIEGLSPGETVALRAAAAGRWQQQQGGDDQQRQRVMGRMMMGAAGGGGRRPGR